MRLLTSREALIEKWALIGTTVVYRIITECLFLLSNFINAANLGGGVRFGEEAFPFFRESFNLLNRENCDIANLYKTKRREPPDS